MRTDSTKVTIRQSVVERTSIIVAQSHHRPQRSLHAGVWSALLVVSQYLCDRPLNIRQRHSTSPSCRSIAQRALPADHTLLHNRTATPIVMRSPEAEMQRVMRTDLLSLLSFRGTRQQACRRCDHYDRSIRTATGQGTYCELNA
ncbi:hypothetical protein TcCL_ESM11184 [Trypanosoma cruzi]|nr:hypothetical protein TcCL_ESM11184 [Trypanosoma cruzi]